MPASVYAHHAPGGAARRHESANGEYAGRRGDFTEDEDVFAADIRKTWALGTRTDLIWAYSRREDNSEFRTLTRRTKRGWASK